jgi:PTS system nitrogen regulatory IIA component
MSSSILAPIGEERLYNALLEREHQGSTGFGGGAAIPHARFEELSDFVLFIVTSRRPLDYEAIDNKKVNVFFFLIGPADAVKEHVKALASIANIISRSNLLDALRNSENGSVLYETFLSKTRDEKPKKERTKQKLLIVVLYDEDLLYDLLEYFLQEGVDGATAIDSTGMGHYISNIPLFSSFVSFMNEDHNRSNTLLVPVPEDQVDTLITGVEEITGDLDKTQGAMMMVLDIAFSKGSMKMM